MPKGERDKLKEELTRLFMARQTAIQQVQALEESFRAMPTHDRVQRLANKRHEIHLIECDIVEIDDVVAEQDARDREIRKALKQLPKAV